MTTWSLPQHPNLPPTCPRKQDTGTKDNLETAVLWEGGPGRGSASGCRQCHPQLQTTRTCPRGLQESWLVRSGEPGSRKPRGHHTAEAPGLCRMPPDPPSTWSALHGLQPQSGQQGRGRACRGPRPGTPTCPPGRDRGRGRGRDTDDRRGDGLRPDPMRTRSKETSGRHGRRGAEQGGVFQRRQLPNLGGKLEAEARSQGTLLPHITSEAGNPCTPGPWRVLANENNLKRGRGSGGERGTGGRREASQWGAPSLEPRAPCPQGVPQEGPPQLTPSDCST